jgi:hypothetical protein
MDMVNSLRVVVMAIVVMAIVAELIAAEVFAAVSIGHWALVSSE